MLQDRQAKARLGYTDPKSRVYTDAQGNVIRETLHGEDWKKRKQELWDRAGGRCEEILQVNHADGGGWERCRSQADDPHHKIKRSKGRNDMIGNLEALCRYHHDRKDNRKVRWSKP